MGSNLTNLVSAPTIPFYNPTAKTLRGELSTVVSLTYANGPLYSVEGTVSS
jgi:hypothetical protein